MIVLDTTILAYAVGDEHPLREPCRRVLIAHADARLDAHTTVEVIQEFVHIRARRRTRGEAVRLARQYAMALGLLETTQDDLTRGLDLFEDHPALGAFDAVLAAVALNRGADALVSADHAFQAVPGLRWVDPASRELPGFVGD